MKTVTFTCNLCTEKKSPNELMSLYWDSTVKNENETFGSYVFKTDVNASDKHVCKNCFSVVHKYAEPFIKELTK